MQAFNHGDYKTARLALERATKQYAEASKIARSDSSIYEAAAQAWLQLAENDVRQKHSPYTSLDHALDVIDNYAVPADPDNAPVHTIRSYVLTRWYRTQSLVGKDDHQLLLERIAEAAARAAKIDPHDARAWDALGNAHAQRGRYDISHGNDDRWWKLALDEISHALAIQPDDPQANDDLGSAHRWRGTSLPPPSCGPPRSRRRSGTLRSTRLCLPTRQEDWCYRPVVPRSLTGIATSCSTCSAAAAWARSWQEGPAAGPPAFS